MKATFPKKQEKESLDNFCGRLVSAYQKIPSEKNIADDFLNYFRLSPPITIDALKNRLSPCVDIDKHDFRGEVRGLYAAFDGMKPQILYDPAEAPPTFTVLHETRHLIGKAFKDAGRGQTSERHCEAFAANVLMPEEMFINDILDKGVDVGLLARKYAVSYSACCIRIAEFVRCLFFVFRKVDSLGNTVRLIHTNAYLPQDNLFIDDPFLCGIAPDRKYHGKLFNGQTQLTVGIQGLNERIIAFLLPNETADLAIVEGTVNIPSGDSLGTQFLGMLKQLTS